MFYGGKLLEKLGLERLDCFFCNGINWALLAWFVGFSLQESLDKQLETNWIETIAQILRFLVGRFFYLFFLLPCFKRLTQLLRPPQFLLRVAHFEFVIREINVLLEVYFGFLI